MKDIKSKNIFRTYTLDYIEKYNFYEKEEFVDIFKDGELILENLKKSKRFDYNGMIYRLTDYGNVSRCIIENNVKVSVNKNDLDVVIAEEDVQLALNYIMEVKKLDNNYRIATKASKFGDNYSLVLYIGISDGEDFINALNEVKNFQSLIFKKKDSDNIK